MDDMPSLIKLNSVVDRLILVYFDNMSALTPNAFGWPAVGEHRQQFIRQGLDDLQAQLSALKQHLVISDGEPETILPALCAKYEVTDIGMTCLDGVYETRQREQLIQNLGHINWHIDTKETLFDEHSLPMALADVDNTFTPWRKKIEGNVDVITPTAPPAHLKPSPEHIHAAALPDTSDGSIAKTWYGGERSGLAQLDYYFEETENLSHYKETRNGLMGWDFSSKLSAWLAAGMLSPRRVAYRIKNYEQHVVKNDSTYWLYFELLWREFFRLQLKKHGHLLFAAGGYKKHKPNNNFESDIYQAWCAGKTGCDIVDAGMRQLNATGFLSNRARQLCASFFIHELNQHWRYGAAYFEYMLIDYDVASNWGNWLYLAGGGSDPRGQRKFDIQAQTERYDPDRAYITHWLR
ncbi:DASH family cryptochrome [Salinimonas sp. HHU 13199]|uniref:Cryptochrome DASH n=1 Tax=Salinimonas profundi TaxID=2729140 RepID=A0ABR8LJJ1_9ALTE|nr:DASH family cryptochrome [Salinimonas profundi]